MNFNYDDFWFFVFFLTGMNVFLYAVLIGAFYGAVYQRQKRFFKLVEENRNDDDILRIIHDIYDPRIIMFIPFMHVGPMRELNYYLWVIPFCFVCLSLSDALQHQEYLQLFYGGGFFFLFSLPSFCVAHILMNKRKEKMYKVLRNQYPDLLFAGREEELEFEELLEEERKKHQ